MDIYCPRCGEPWEVYSVQHDFDREEQRNFRAGKGCPSCFRKFKEKILKNPGEKAWKTAVAMELLGDDWDGIAACVD